MDQHGPPSPRSRRITKSGSMVSTTRSEAGVKRRESTSSVTSKPKGGPNDGHMGIHHEGWLFKWTNYLRGYRQRFFVLHDGTLSYYRSKEEMKHTIRGTVNSNGAE
eukprot:Colp12_sorted_trinity150504_noHs@10847